jgi:hypothetical protein
MKAISSIEKDLAYGGKQPVRETVRILRYIKENGFWKNNFMTYFRQGVSMRMVVVFGIIILLCVKSGYCLDFVAYGDTRDNPTEHTKLIGQMAKDSPEVILHVGDLWGGTGPVTWKANVTSQPNIAALLNANKFLVARGNHETESEVLAFIPTLVRHDSILYSCTEGNCFFACMGYDPGLNNAWLETQLSSAAAQNAAWRFVWAHKPIYSTGSHGADGSTSEGTSIVNFRSLCDKYKVNIVFSGHDHIYERSKLIYNGQVADSTDNFPATVSGTVYVLTGAGGAPLYTVATTPPWWRKFGQSVYEFCFIQADSDSLVLTARKDDGTRLDRFVWQRAATSSMPKPVVLCAGNNPRFGMNKGKLFFTLVTPEKAFLRLYDMSGKMLADFSRDCRTMRAGANSIGSGIFSTGVYVAEFCDGETVIARTVSVTE